MTTSLDIVLWVVVPYVCLAVFVGGHAWRYRYDKFGWDDAVVPAVREPPAALG